MSDRGKVKIVNPDWCKACGICVSVCPTDVLALVSSEIQIKDRDACIGCDNCELSCPDFVLKVVKEND